jgi:hypothetical protein
LRTPQAAFGSAQALGDAVNGAGSAYDLMRAIDQIIAGRIQELKGLEGMF